MRSADLQRENQDLQDALREQQAVTEEVRHNAQDALREMRELSQQSNVSYERQEALEAKVDQLEQEVRDWRGRYTKAKTQLRNMRASSMGLTVEREATTHLRDKGLTDDDGLVKDVHVTRFQIAVDDILQQARTDDPDRIMDAMKAVVVSVRRITKDLDTAGAAAPRTEEAAQAHGRLKAKVSQTANTLHHQASKNHANSAGLAPRGAPRRRGVTPRRRGGGRAPLGEDTADAPRGSWTTTTTGQSRPSTRRGSSRPRDRGSSRLRSRCPRRRRSAG